MTVTDIYKFIDGIAPFATAEDFDNVGILVGDGAMPVTHAVVALDCTPEALAFATAQGAQLVVTHHPVIFDPLKSIDTQSVVYKAIASGVAVLSAHTNLDFAPGGVCDTLAAALGLTGLQALPCGLRVGNIDPLPPREFAALAKNQLGCDAVRFTAGKTTVRRVAVCSGSGGSMLPQVLELDVDAYLCGDIKLSVFLEGTARGLTLVDAGHFETERLIVPVLRQKLERAFPQLCFSEFNSNPIKHL